MQSRVPGGKKFELWWLAGCDAAHSLKTNRNALILGLENRCWINRRLLVMIPRTINSHWWQPNKGFFGRLYLSADPNRVEDKNAEGDELVLRTKLEAEGILRLLELSPRASILDCPCGYGRHSKFLAQRGFEVTGVDLNPEHLAEAKKNSRGVKFLEGDMRSLGFSDQFDAVVNIFASFGFFSESEDLDVLKGFFMHSVTVANF
jgi:SAM-dependent methyltransferase